MISSYIKELLKIHNRVIVPDLGAFLKKSENPNQIYFNEFLRFNDGLLVDYISEKESVDKIEAAKKLKTFVADIIKGLKEKRFVDLTDIGTLSMDSNDKIQLKIELLKAYIPEEIVSPTPTPPPAEKEVKIETPVQAEIKQPEKPPKPKRGKKETEIELEVQKSVVPEPVKQEPKLSQTVIEPADQNEEVYYVEEKSGSRTFLWIGMVALLMLLVLAWFYIVKPRLNKASDQNNVLMSQPAQTDTLNDSVAEPVKDVPIIETAETKYYVVAGCFAMEVNANNMVKELTSKGYQAVKFTKIAELYYVASGSYNSQSEAQRELNKIVALGYQGCWLMKFPR